MRRTTPLLVALIFSLASCGGERSNDGAPRLRASPEKLLVYTVNYPLAYFAERIGGDLVDVRFPPPTDEDPAYWSPDAETIAETMNVQ